MSFDTILIIMIVVHSNGNGRTSKTCVAKILSENDDEIDYS
jgi:hypothetical protein